MDDFTLNEDTFSDSFISSITSTEEVTGHSLIYSSELYSYMDENYFPDEFKKLLDEGNFPTSILLHVLDEDGLQAYAKEIGVSYTELTDENKMTGTSSIRLLLLLWHQIIVIWFTH